MNMEFPHQKTKISKLKMEILILTVKAQDLANFKQN